MKKEYQCSMVFVENRQSKRVMLDGQPKGDRGKDLHFLGNRKISHHRRVSQQIGPTPVLHGSA